MIDLNCTWLRQICFDCSKEFQKIANIQGQVIDLDKWQNKYSFVMQLVFQNISKWYNIRNKGFIFIFIFFVSS